MKLLYDKEIGKYVPALPKMAQKIAKLNKKLDDITKSVMKEIADAKIKVSK